MNIYTDFCPVCGKPLEHEKEKDLDYGQYYHYIECPDGCYYWEGYYGYCE